MNLVLGLKVTPVFTLIALFSRLQYVLGQSLDCFSCTNITNLDDCHTTRQCLPAEFCYTESYNLGGVGPLKFSMGCREKEFCQGMDQSNLIGKRQVPPPLSGCLQCCSLHGCNKYLCPVRFTAAPPPAKVDGAWSSWQPWESCSATCGIGLRSRHRECNNPAPSGNGRNCLGDLKDVALCNIPCTDGPVVTNPPTQPPIKTTPVPQPPQTTSAVVNPTTPNQYVTHDVTQAPGECKDLIDCSGYYRPEACHGIYSPWAHRYCPVHCGFCKDTSPKPCVDTVPNCHEYQNDICTNQAFWQWRESHCRKYCKLCE